MQSWLWIAWCPQQQVALYISTFMLSSVSDLYKTLHSETTVYDNKRAPSKNKKYPRLHADCIHAGTWKSDFPIYNKRIEDVCIQV